MKRLAALIALLAALPATASAAGWTRSASIDPPSSQYASLGGVACPQPDLCIAVGGSLSTDPFADGTTLAERFDGHTWSLLPAPADAVTLSPLKCQSPTFCIAVGAALHGAYVGERWDGSTWTSMGGFGHRADAVTSLSCASATSCLTVGFRGKRAVAARWDGTRWQDLATPRAAAALWSVACTAPDACTAVGSSTDRAHKPLVLRFDGASWTAQPDAAPSDEALGAVACAAPDACLAAVAPVFTPATRKVRRAAGAERWDGRRWHTANTGMPRGAELRDIDCRSATDCTAVGMDIDRRQALVVHWDGGRWTPIATPHLLPGPLGSPFELAFPVLGAVACPVGAPCIAVGARAISRTESRTLAETG